MKTTYLKKWSEAVGILKSLDRNRNKVTLKILREVRVKLPPKKLDELNDVIGKKVYVLRTDSHDSDEFIIRVEGGN